MSRRLTPLAAAALLAAAAAALFWYSQRPRWDSRTIWAFDTFVVITGPRSAAFTGFADKAERRLNELHRLYSVFDGYHGINNLKTLNDNAGGPPVPVAAEIIDLLEFALWGYRQTDGAVNVAIGPVTEAWRRSGGKLPDVTEAAKLCDINGIEIDREAGTARLAKPGMRLDAGAVAKGYAVRRIVEELPAPGGTVINAGGNVYAFGAAQIAVADPFAGGEALFTLTVEKKAAATSANDHRYYEVDGERYGHIISPDSFLPANRFASVTVVHDDAGIADLLSTALFVLPRQTGMALAERLGAGVIWVSPGGDAEIFGDVGEVIDNPNGGNK